MRLNLASGQRPFPTWTNVDIRKQKNSDGQYYQCEIEADVTERLPFEDGSVDVIVAHHLWEHIPLHKHEQTVREWHRILKVGGKILVSVPNMKEIARRWLNGEIDTFTFCVNATGAWQGHITDLHRWEYDDKELIDRFSCWNGKEKLFPFNTRIITQPNELGSDYDGADIAFDWWILTIEFIKI